MSTTEALPGLWGSVERRVGDAGPARGELWDRLSSMVDVGDFRPQLAPDIETRQFERLGGEPYYMVANPRDLVHFRLQRSDQELLQLMDGTRTVKEIVVERFRDSGEMELANVAGLVWALYTENFLTQRYVDVDHMLDTAMHPSRRKLRQFARTL